MIEITKTPHEHKIEELELQWRKLFVLIQENRDAMTDVIPTFLANREIDKSNKHYTKVRKALFPV